MKLHTIIRYGLCAATIATANANRRHYRMATTWLPHLAMNSFALLLPDMIRQVTPAAPVRERPDSDTIRAAAATVASLVCDNPTYVAYVAPLTIGYLLSHPEFNIYKGAWGELSFAGFGFDALPHSAAAFTLAALSSDTAEEAAQRLPDGPLAIFARWCAEHPALFSGLVVAVVTLLWEVGEYRMHHHELALRGDVNAINMQWSAEDTLTDCAANMIGWAAAAIWRANRTRSGTVALEAL